jgi:hypothetical protein
MRSLDGLPGAAVGQETQMQNVWPNACKVTADGALNDGH